MSVAEYLSTLNFGASTGGAAGSAETTSTLGTARTSVRQPPDTDHVDGNQLAQFQRLLLAISQFLKGGTRLQALSQSSNPFGTGEKGYWVDATATPNARFFDGTNNNLIPAAPLTTKGDIIGFNGTNFVRLGVGTDGWVLTADSTKASGWKWAAGGGGGSTTLAAAYTNGSSATDVTLLLNSTNGKVILKDNGTPIGTLLELQTNAAATLYKWDATSLTFGAGQGVATTAGAGSVDWSNMSGTYKTPTGAHTINGAVTFAANKGIAYTAGTGAADFSNGSGVFKTTTGASTFGGSSNTFSSGALGPASGQQHTLPAVASDTFALLAATQTLAAKTLTAPIINGCTSASGNIDFSGSSGTWKPPTGGLNATLAFQADNTFAIGALNFKASSVSSYKYYTKQQTKSGGGAISIDSASGSSIILQLGSTATTSVSIVACSDFAQDIAVIVKQDATGGRSCPTTWTNCTFPGGTYTVSAGANAVDVIWFTWDNGASKWRASSPALNQS